MKRSEIILEVLVLAACVLTMVLYVSLTNLWLAGEREGLTVWDAFSYLYDAQVFTAIVVWLLGGGALMYGAGCITIYMCRKFTYFQS